jgi:hypothetical protein
MRSIACSLLAVAVAGCGAEAKPASRTPQDEVERTVVKVHAAVRSRSAERVCALYSAEAKRDMRTDYGSTCEETLKVALAGVPVSVLSRPAKVGHVAIKGNKATVTAQSGEEDPLVLVREGKAWKVYRDAPPTAVKAAPECVSETGDIVRKQPGARDLPRATADELVERLCARGSQAGLLPLLGTVTDEEAALLTISVVDEMKGEGKLTEEQALAVLR